MNVIVAQSTVSDGSMLNRHNREDPVVIQNRIAFLERHGIKHTDTTRLGLSYDTESFCRYQLIDATAKGNGMHGITPEYADAYVVTQPNHAILLPVADCIGAVLFDPVHEVLMVSHLGRHSLEQDGAYQSVAFLQKHFASNPKELKVWMTAAPNQEVYPIWALDGKGMKQAAFEQLERAGINQENIQDNPADTATDEQYYSFSEFLKGNRTDDGDHCIVAMMTEA